MMITWCWLANGKLVLSPEGAEELLKEILVTSHQQASMNELKDS